MVWCARALRFISSTRATGTIMTAQTAVILFLHAITAATVHTTAASESVAILTPENVATLRRLPPAPVLLEPRRDRA